VEWSGNERGINTRKSVWVPKETPPRDSVTNLLGYMWHMQSDVFIASLEHVQELRLVGTSQSCFSGKLNSLTPSVRKLHRSRRQCASLFCARGFT